MNRIELQLLVACLWSLSATADELLVAAASNFSAPMNELVLRFEARTDHKVEVAYGSSGRLFAQISNGAPFQIFFSADQDKPERLLASGLAVPGSRFTYATGALVLWNADDKVAVPDASVLSQNSELLIALANPRVAPYGTAAMEAIESLALSEAVAGRLVLGENIAQAYQFVDLGNAPLGFVAKSQVFRDGRLRKGSGWEVPADLHAPIRQDAVLLNSAQDCQPCQQLMAFVQQPEQRALLASWGYRFD
jgi:molybdate transport system substrate-binding protein